MRPVLGTIICSTRPGRVGATVAEWFHGVAETTDIFDCRLLDLAEFGLPVFDEPGHPKNRNYVHDHTRRWSDAIARCDAFVFVSPEYNYGPPPSLVNALTYLFHEWNYKPAGLVTYGGISGGGRGGQATKLLLTALRVMPILENVMVPGVATQLDALRRFQADELQTAAAVLMISELQRWERALCTLRENENKKG